VGLWRSAHTGRTTAPAGPLPQDVEALEQVLLALDGGVDDRHDAQRRTTTALVDALGLAYAAVWTLEANGRFALATETGDLADAMSRAGGGARTLPPDAGLLGEAVRTRRAVMTSETPQAGTSCLRWQHAQQAGMVEAAAVPVVEDGQVVSVLECFSRHPLPAFGGQKWRTLGRIMTLTRRQAYATHALTQTLDDRQAVTTVVTEVGRATDEQTALRVALETVRTAFGWAYGSYWRLDEDEQVLRFEVESGSAGEEFRQVTLAASFAQGVGLSGRTWRARDLVFVSDLAEVTDCVRAPAAQRAGVRSGVCFPVMDGDRVIGTMDFFTTETIELSESRRAALRNVQQLVSQRLAVLRRVEQDTRSATLLLQTVSELRDAADDAGQVADQAVQRSAIMTREVEALGQASAAIGDVIEVISRIAAQTNLLALNATIEAARAGQAGRGFTVVAQEVKDLARETAQATQRVAEQVAGLQASSRTVAAGITLTSDIIGQLGPVQTRMNDVLAEQARMAQAFASSQP